MMKKTTQKAIILSTLLFWGGVGLAQTSVAWSKTYGGNGAEEGHCIKNTSDGGFIISGYTDSDNNGDVSGYHGGADVWVVKLDNSGNLEWQNAYGGSGADVSDVPSKVIQTSDGGYLVTTASNSSDGDLTENHGNTDLWAFKIDNDGDIEWQLSLGSNVHDVAYDLLEDPDGSFLLAGITFNSALNQGWLVRLSATGSLIDEKTFGGSWMDWFTSIRHTADGGYIVSGVTSSMSDPGNYWVVKLDASTEVEWETELSGTAGDMAMSIIQAPDGGYVVAGVSESGDGDVGANFGENDWWVAKLDNTGAMVWEKNLGGSDEEEFGSMEALSDGSGFVMVGTTQSFDGDVTTNHGNPEDPWQERRDVWLVKMDYSGNIIMNQCFGSASSDIGLSVIETAGGEIVIAGGGGPEITNDLWAFKIGGTTGIEDLSTALFSVYPNPTNDFVTLSNLPNNSTIKITDITGKVIYNSVINAEQMTISATDFVNGVYFIQVESNGAVANKKLVVNK